MSEDDLLTTAEAARIARVGGSSVKRWADQRLLPCVRTAGGHRRFRRADLERFLASLTDRDSGSAESWAELCLHATMHEVWGEIVAARGRAGAYYPVMAELGLGLVELGRRWERGEVTILDEHAASEKLARALERTADGMSYDPTSPTAVLAVAERDEHTLGLSLAEVVLREAGWNVRWAGRQTPVRELSDLVAQGSVELVALSASAASTEAHRLAAQLRTLVPVCKQHGVKLVLGGSGAWPEALEYGVVMRDFAALHAFAENLRRDLAGG
jgi:MerR family transcriptional regulator, light-induced transcriptional regulator